MNGRKQGDNKMNSPTTFKSLTTVFRESPDIKNRVDELLDNHMSLTHIGHAIFEEYNITLSLDDLRLYALFIHRNPCITALKRRQ
jgi:succinylglutamate desuccinylase